MPNEIEKVVKYSRFVIAALVVIAASVAFFLYNLIFSTDPTELPVGAEVSESGAVGITPSMNGPTGPPNIAPPTSPPPGN